MQSNQSAKHIVSYDYEEIIGQIKASGITSVCSTINNFNRLMDDENVAAKNKDLEELVQNDISLSIEVLKVANSPFFLSVNKKGIDSISDAIKIIGWDTVYKIGLALTVKGLVKTVNARTFARWMINHAIMIANISEIFLESLQTYNKNLSGLHSIYAYDLLHDVGALGLLQVIDNYHQDVMAIKLTCSNKSWSDAEQELYSFNHNRVGAAILVASRLPMSFVTVANYHHKPEYKFYTVEDRQRIALIRLAQMTYIDPNKFSEHAPLSKQLNMDDTKKTRDFNEFSEDRQIEFEEQLGINEEIFSKIKASKLTDSAIDQISDQFTQ